MCRWASLTGLRELLITAIKRKTQYWEDEEGTNASWREVMMDGYDQQTFHRPIHFSKNKLKMFEN